MKRILALILVCFTFCVVLCGCGGDNLDGYEQRISEYLDAIFNIYDISDYSYEIVDIHTIDSSYQYYERLMEYIEEDDEEYEGVKRESITGLREYEIVVSYNSESYTMRVMIGRVDGLHSIFDIEETEGAPGSARGYDHVNSSANAPLIL